MEITGYNFGRILTSDVSIKIPFASYICVPLNPFPLIDVSVSGNEPVWVTYNQTCLALFLISTEHNREKI